MDRREMQHKVRATGGCAASILILIFDNNVIYCIKLVAGPGQCPVEKSTPSIAVAEGSFYDVIYDQ